MGGVRMVHLAPQHMVLVQALGACCCGVSVVVELGAGDEMTWMNLESEEMMVE